MTRSEEMKGIREKMQDDIDEVNKIAHNVKNRLERLDKANEAALTRPVSLLLINLPHFSGRQKSSATWKSQMQKALPSWLSQVTRQHLKAVVCCKRKGLTSIPPFVDAFRLEAKRLEWNKLLNTTNHCSCNPWNNMKFCIARVVGGVLLQNGQGQPSLQR